VIPSPVLVALTILGVSFVVCGGLVITHRAVMSGCLLVASGTAGIGGAILEATDHADFAQLTLTAGGALCLPLAMTTYPHPVWRHPVDFVSLATVTGAGLLAIAQWSDVGTVAVMTLVIGLVLVAHTWWRIERSTRDDQWALTWMALSFGVCGLLAFLVIFVFPSTPAAAVAVGQCALLGAGMAIGVARPNVVDVRGWVVHTVVFGVAAIVYVAGFVTLASLFELVGGTAPAVGMLAVIGLAVAVTLHPMRVVLRGVIDELLFGHRPDPLGAASHVAGRIGEDPLLALRAIREALVVPYAAVNVDGEQLAQSGTPVTHARTLPLDLGEDRRGELVVGLRTGDVRLSPGDEQALRLVSPLLAQTLRAGALATDLQAAREETVTALEEERRRLRRDLHDGLGPRLSGIAFTSDAARNSLRSDPDAANALLVALRAETVTALDDIRRLVYAMRPPALDELGLVPALRQQAGTIRTARGEPLRVTVTASQVPPELPAAVEVAAFRIVMEALTNVARHSESETAEVRLSFAVDGLVIEVADRGEDASTWSDGVGITSMRERADELGGVLTAGGGPNGGLVRAVLPVAESAGANVNGPAGPAAAPR
jgi:signal transduction histidine kinase